MAIPEILQGHENAVGTQFGVTGPLHFTSAFNADIFYLIRT